MVGEVDDFGADFRRMAAPPCVHITVIDGHLVQAPFPRLLRELQRCLERRPDLNVAVVSLDEAEFAVQAIL